MTFSGRADRWRQSLTAGVAAAWLSSLIRGSLMGLDGRHAVQVMAAFSNSLILGLTTVLCGSAMLALVKGGVVEQWAGECSL
jgi:uncharacterized membrane protein